MDNEIHVEKTYDEDCSTCAHRVPRHDSRRESITRQRIYDYVCLVCGKAICEHGTSTQKTTWDGGCTKRSLVFDVPCKAYDKQTGRWYALDWDPADE